MRVIPVIDLKGGVAVHAVRGERERYRPVRSRIAAGSDPVELTRAVRDRFGLDEVYVADLDAIAGGAGNGRVIAALAAEARAMVDAGTSSAGAVARVLDLGAARVIVGTESLPGVEAFRALRAALPDAPLVVSLDLRAGRVLSPDPVLGGLRASEALARLSVLPREAGTESRAGWTVQAPRARRRLNRAAAILAATYAMAALLALAIVVL